MTFPITAIRNSYLQKYDRVLSANEEIEFPTQGNMIYVWQLKILSSGSTSDFIEMMFNNTGQWLPFREASKYLTADGSLFGQIKIRNPNGYSVRLVALYGIGNYWDRSEIQVEIVGNVLEDILQYLTDVQQELLEEIRNTSEDQLDYITRVSTAIGEFNTTAAQTVQGKLFTIMNNSTVISANLTELLNVQEDALNELESILISIDATNGRLGSTSSTSESNIQGKLLAILEATGRLGSNVDGSLQHKLTSILNSLGAVGNLSVNTLQGRTVIGNNILADILNQLDEIEVINGLIRNYTEDIKDNTENTFNQLIDQYSLLEGVLTVLQDSYLTVNEIEVSNGLIRDNTDQTKETIFLDQIVLSGDNALLVRPAGTIVQVNISIRLTGTSANYVDLYHTDGSGEFIGTLSRDNPTISITNPPANIYAEETSSTANALLGIQWRRYAV